ncbi:MAG: GFA family protein [Pseudomonadota bacterium]
MTGVGSARLSGKCLCGAVAFEAARERDRLDACHCALCRRWSGHYWASVNVRRETVKFLRGEEKIGWHRSSAHVRRGFCTECGSALFWQPDLHPEHSHIFAISAGSLDAPTGLTLSEHIFVGEKGDYYAIADGLAQRPGH